MTEQQTDELFDVITHDPDTETKTKVWVARFDVDVDTLDPDDISVLQEIARGRTVPGDVITPDEAKDILQRLAQKVTK